jgi:hypothetical protein
VKDAIDEALDALKAREEEWGNVGGLAQSMGLDEETAYEIAFALGGAALHLGAEEFARLLYEDEELFGRILRGSLGSFLVGLEVGRRESRGA